MKIIHTKDIPEVGVSHNEEIKKKVFLKKGSIPKLMAFGSATLKPGQFVDTHAHETMFEVFYIQSGKALFIFNQQKSELFAGDCIVLEPGEHHSQSNPYDEDVSWLYFGIATD